MIRFSVSCMLLLWLCIAGAQAQDVSLATDNAVSFKGARRIAIDQFGVEFITTLKASGTGGGASASVQAELQGISDEAMQAITDRAYRDTVAELTKAGFEVLPLDALLARPEYQELAARTGRPSPFVIDDTPSISKIFAPTGMRAYFQTSGGRGSLSERMVALDGANGAKSSALAKTLDAHFVRFHYLASFGTTAASKGFLANIAGRAHASVDLGPTLLANETQAQITSQEGQRIFRTSSRSGVNGSVYLNKNLRLPADGYEMKDTTSAESKQSDNISNAVSLGLTLLTGGRTARSTNNATAAVTVAPETFNDSYLKLIALARGALIERLKKEAQ